MKPSIRSKLETLSGRLQELSALLAEPDVVTHQERFRALSMEYAQLEPVVRCFNDYRQTLADLATAEELAALVRRELGAIEATHLGETMGRQGHHRLRVPALRQPLADPTGPNRRISRAG